MRSVFASVVGLATGLFVASMPVANGLVLLMGTAVGVTLTLALQLAVHDVHMKEGAQPASESALRDRSDREVSVDA